jgi:predicted lipid-binding transport protein (Tim44 family)|tara:strand:+ start:63 stop:698 length:636 start_codon:yes stop_codon:yes gene_type:complete
MQLSLPFIDIIIFAIIAIFLVYRLKSILGQNSDGNEQNNKIDIGKKDFTNVVKLGNRQSDSNDKKTNKDSIYSEDPTFNEKEFLKGAQNFFEMVIDSFVKGELKNIEMYIDNKLIKNFQLVIDERLQEKETLDINIIKMISIRIEDVKKLKNFLRVSVLFESEQIKVLKDKEGKIIDGDQKKSILVKDLWTFEKKIQSKDLNWILVETSDA